MKTGFVYKLTFPNGKVYVGITTETIKRRVSRHIQYARSNRPYALSAAIRKFGEDSFSVEEIGSGLWAELLAMEIFFIKEYCSLAPNGYNMTLGGEGTSGVSPSAEVRLKLSNSLSGRKLSSQHREAVSVAQKGKKIPQFTRDLMRKAAAGRRIDPAICRKGGMALKGRSVDPQVIAKRVATRRANALGGW